MATSSVMKPVLPVHVRTANFTRRIWNHYNLFPQPPSSLPSFAVRTTESLGGSLCTRLLIQYSCIVNQNPVYSWYLWWKVFQCGKKQSLLMFETRQCCFKKVTLIQFHKNPCLLHWLVSQNLTGEHEGWKFERTMAWFCHWKWLISWIGETQTLIFSPQI